MKNQPDAKKTTTFVFASNIISEGSWGSRDLTNAPVHCEMEWFEGDDAGHAMIEWIIPAIDEVEHIGLTFEWQTIRPGVTGDFEPARVLMEYDGTMSLPSQAVLIIQAMGCIVPRGEGFDEELDAALKLEFDEIPLRVLRLGGNYYGMCNGTLLCGAVNADGSLDDCRCMCEVDAAFLGDDCDDKVAHAQCMAAKAALS